MAAAQEGLNRVPSEWKWISPTEAAFTFDGTYGDAGAFICDLEGNKRFGIPAGLRTPKAGSGPGLENPPLSPDRALTA